MKIYNNSNITKINQLYNRNKKIEKTNSTESVRDEIQISTKAKDFQYAMKAFRNLPEIREEKVAKIKEQIENNTYNISGKEVADKIMESIMIDRKI